MGGEGASTTVFVDNNLGRHLALVVFLSDAVLDLKKKIEAEFPFNYPDIGEVKVESLKVRREGKLYSVRDSMPVNAFCEANGSCFVSVEARAFLRERVDAVGCGDRVKPIEYRYAREAVNRDWKGEGEKSESLRVRGVGDNLMDGGVFERGLENGLCDKRNGESEETSRRAGKNYTPVLDRGKTKEEITARTGMPDDGGDQGKVLPYDVALEHMRDGVSNKGGDSEAGSNQKSKRGKCQRGKRESKRTKENDASALDHGTTKSSLDPVVAESWVANAVAGALCDVKGGTKSAAEGPSISASSDSTRSRNTVHHTDVLLEEVDTRGEVVTCEKNESRNKVSNVNFSEDVEDASNSKSIVVAKKKRKIDKAKTDAVSMKENNSLVSGNGESTSRPQLASKVIRDDPNSRNSTLKSCSDEDHDSVHSQSNVIGYNKKKSRKKTTDTTGNELYKVPAAPVSENMVSEPPTFSVKDCNLALGGSDHASSPLGNATTSASKRMRSSKDGQTDNVGENHYLMNKRSDDGEEFDWHGKDDRIQSLQSTGVKEHSRCGVENEHDIVMGERVLETGSHKKSKRIVKKGHKSAEEGYASLHEIDEKGSTENVAISIDETSVLVKAPVIVDSGKSSKKPRKSKDKKNVNGALAAGAEHTEGLRIDITPSQSLKVDNEAVSVDVGDNEAPVTVDSGKSSKKPRNFKDKKDADGSLALGAEHTEGPRIDVTPSQSLKVVNEAQSFDVGNNEAPVTVDSGKSSKKPRKSKDKRDVDGSPALVAEHTEGPRIDATSSQSLKVVNEAQSVDVGNKEDKGTHKDEKFASEMGIPSVVLSDGGIVHKAPDSSPLMESVQANIVGEEGKSKKKLKKIKSSGAKDETTEKGLKENVAVPIDETSELVKAPVTVDSGKSSKKPRKSINKKDVNEAPASGAECTEGPRIDVTPSQSLKVVNDAQSVDVGNKEDKGNHKDEKIVSEMGIPSDGGIVHRAPDSSPLMESVQANIVGEEGKSKKKLKKIKSSGAKDETSEKGSKENVAVPIDETSELVKAPVTVDSGKSSKKPRKSIDKKDVNEAPASGAERTEGPRINITPSQSLKVVNETQSVDVGNNEAPVTVDSGKSSKKPRKFTDKKDVNEAPASGPERTEGPRIEITPSQSLKVVNDALSVDVGNKEDKGTHKDEKIASEMGAVIPSVVLSDGGIVHKAPDSSPLIESAQANIVGEEGKSKKKLKKIKSSGAKDVAKLLLETGKDNPQAQELSMSNDKDMGFSSKKAKQTDQDDASGVSRLTRSKLQHGDVEDNPPEACHKNEASNDMEASSRSDGINFQGYFCRSQEHENVVSGEATAGASDEAKQIDGKTNGDKLDNARPIIRKEDGVESGPKKISANNAGEAVNSSEPETRLHEKPVALSEDNMDGSSTNEDSPACSDASTRTPSDYSLSSDYSDGGSNAVNSLNKGSTKYGGKKSKKALMSGLSLDEILRSSRSYKKAKINASQTLLDDMESQTVDVIPDSCPGL